MGWVCASWYHTFYQSYIIKKGLSEEFKEEGIAVNALWPRTTIATAAVANLLGGEEAIKYSRNDNIMGDSAFYILTSDSK